MNGRTNSTKEGDTIINGALIPLESPTAFAAAPQDGKVILTWTDPVDKVANPGGEMVTPWSYTIVVRKIGSYPQTPKDGTEILRETTRNQYQTTGYTDTLSIENDITYYYALFAISTFDVWSEPATSTAKPVEAHPQFYKTTLLTSYGEVSYGEALSSTQSHFIRTGGSGTNEYEESDLKAAWGAYDKDLTLTNLNNGTRNSWWMTPGRFNGNALFLPGDSRYRPDNASYGLWVVTPNLTVRSFNTRTGPGQYVVGIAATDTHAFLAGGSNDDLYKDANNQVDAYTTSFTRQTAPDLSYGTGKLAGTHVGEYALFSCGEAGWNVDTILAFAYSDTLTKVENIATAYQSSCGDIIGAASTGNYAIFGGDPHENLRYSSPTSTAYDSSLTRLPQINLLHSPVVNTNGVDVGSYALFGYQFASGNDVGGVAVTCFNNTLTKMSNVGTITQGDNTQEGLVHGAGFADNFALFMDNEGYVYMFQYA